MSEPHDVPPTAAPAATPHPYGTRCEDVAAESALLAAVHLESIAPDTGFGSLGQSPGPNASLAGRYEVLGEVGRGGMGCVLRGRDPVLGRDLAIKVLLHQHAGRLEVVQRFKEEAQIGGQLQHPGVVPVYDLGLSADAQPYFTMKLVKGETLAQLLRQRSDPAQERPRFLKVFEQVCQTVAYAHSKGVLHRDLKPANVMVGAFGEVQVMDWGLAKVLAPAGVNQDTAAVRSDVESTIPSVIKISRPETEAPATHEGDVLGTPAYMPPEQALGEIDRLDERCDVFSLGAILCEILTGRPPYAGADGQEVLRRARRADLADTLARLDSCGADAELIGLARCCLAAQPAARPRNASEVAQEVEAYRSGVEERARKAELERVAALARAEEAQVTAREAEAREAAEKRQAEEARARAEAERRRADESERRVTAERRARRLTVGLAAAALVLVVTGGSGAWVWQQRRETANALTRAALEQGRSRLEEAWKRNDVGKLEAAVTEADKALGLADSGASAALREEAVALHAEAEEKLKQAKKNADLLAALLNVTAPRETKQYVRGDSGTMMALAEPSVEEQFVQAFRRRDSDSDFDRTPLETLVRRLKDQPEAVVQEIVAGLDIWMLDRRRRQRPEAPSPLPLFPFAGKRGRGEGWRRLFQVAEQLDRDEESRKLRQSLVSGALEREAAGRALARLLPGSALMQAHAGKQTQRLREQATQAARSRGPVLRLVTLARALEGVGDVKEATQLMRAAVTTQPDREVLLDALGKLLERQGPAHREEAIACYRAVRALRPRLGIALGEALREAGRTAEAKGVFVDLRDRQPNNPEMSLYLGRVLDHQKKLAEAEAAYRKAILLQPDLALAHYNLGIVLRDQKRLAEAEAAYRRAIALQPDDAAAHNNLGLVLRAQKKLTEAEAAYRRAIALQPDLAGAYGNLGNVLADQKKLSEAEAAFRRTIALKPDDALAHYALGNVLADQKKLAEAETAFRRAIALKPDYAEAYSNLGAALGAQKKLAEAETANRRAIALQPDYAKAYSNLGNVLHAQKKLSEAEVAHRRAIALQPDLAGAYVNLGLVLADQKKLAEAETACRRAIALQPDFASAYSNLGTVLHAQKKLVEAEAAYRRAIALQPDLAMAHYNLGIVLRDQKKLTEAEAAYRRAIALQPDLAGAYVNLGVVLADQKKLAEAEATFRRAIALQPDHADAYVNLGNALRDQKKLAEAEAAYRRAIALQPDLALAHCNLGAALGAQKRLPEAETACRRAIALQPDYADAYFNLGNALRDQKKLAQAEAAFRKAIALQPNFAPAYNNLGNVVRNRGKFREAETAFRRADQLLPNHPIIRSNLAQSKRLLELDSRLAAVQVGKAQPRDARERLDLALFCGNFKQQYAAAVGFFADAFAADPKLEADLKTPYRSTALRFAALAVAGKGEDAGTLNDQQRARLRKQALDWLRADLDVNTTLADKAAGRPLIRQRLAFWLKDEALASVRDDKPLATLPEGERKDWRKLWADVAALLKKVEPKK